METNLRDIQYGIGKQAILQDQLPIESIKRIASFSCASLGEKIVCGVIVYDIPSKQVIERKHIIKKAPMPYVPGYLAFREGPLMLELYYQLEADPDVLMLEGHGVAHPAHCGIATYLGVELGKPSIGIADSIMYGELQDTSRIEDSAVPENGVRSLGKTILIDGQIAGSVVQTKQFARPIFVTCGHLISAETATQLVTSLVILPHKMPEPLHIAKRYATKTRDNIAEEATVKA